MEKTLVINGEPTKYLVSDEGYVKIAKTQRIIKMTINKNGDAQVDLRLPNETTTRRMVSHLVAENYCALPKNGKNVIHLDGNKLNNKVENLAWADAKQVRANAKQTRNDFKLHMALLMMDEKNELQKFRDVIEKYDGMAFDFQEQRKLETECDIQLATAAHLTGFNMIKKMAYEKFGIDLRETA